MTSAEQQQEEYCLDYHRALIRFMVSQVKMQKECPPGYRKPTQEERDFITQVNTKIPHQCLERAEHKSAYAAVSLKFLAPPIWVKESLPEAARKFLLHHPAPRTDSEKILKNAIVVYNEIALSLLRFSTPPGFEVLPKDVMLFRSCWRPDRTHDELAIGPLSDDSQKIYIFPGMPDFAAANTPFSYYSAMQNLSGMSQRFLRDMLKPDRPIEMGMVFSSGQRTNYPTYEQQVNGYNGAPETYCSAEAQAFVRNHLMLHFAKKDEKGTYRRLPDMQPICRAFSKILLFGHCRGGQMVGEVENALVSQMRQLRYSDEEIKQAMGCLAGLTLGYNHIAPEKKISIPRVSAIHEKDTGALNIGYLEHKNQDVTKTWCGPVINLVSHKIAETGGRHVADRLRSNQDPGHLKVHRHNMYFYMQLNEEETRSGNTYKLIQLNPTARFLRNTFSELMNAGKDGQIRNSREIITRTAEQGLTDVSIQKELRTIGQNDSIMSGNARSAVTR